MPRRLTTRVYRGTPRNLARLAQALRRGELVAVPTETVYGLAGNALDPRACRAIFRAKGRPAHDPLIVHVHSLEQAATVAHLNDEARQLARAFWPGPLTLVLPKTTAVPSLVTSGLSSVAVRMPAHRLFRALLQRCGLPLAAPSANPFGYISPTSAEHVRQSLGGKIAHILDGGPARIGLESTILDLRHPQRPVLLRPGAIAREELERVLQRPIAHRTGAPRRRQAAVAPGLLSRHYSPHTPLFLHARLPDSPPATTASGKAFLYLAKPPGARQPSVFWLDSRGRLPYAARRLFAMLRQLDEGSWREIHAELAPGDGTWALAINDRLRRAAAQR